MQDSYGSIWLGTNGSLNCYNGWGNKVYRNILNDKFSLENNFVQALSEEESQNIWVGTNWGLYIYDREYDRFSYFDKKTRYGVFINGEIKKIIKTESGLIWIVTLGQGSFVYDPKTDMLTQDSLQTFFAWDARENDSHHIYVSSLQEGLPCFDESGEFLQSYPLLSTGNNPGNYHINCLPDVCSDIWFGAGSNLLHCLNECTGKLDSYNASHLNFGVIHCLPGYSETELLVGTDNGLYLSDLRDKTFSWIDNPSDPRNLSGQSINAMMRDAEGGIWVLTNLGGVNYLAKPTRRFGYYPPVHRDGGITAGKVVGPFCENAAGNIWVGTHDGLCFFDVPTYQLTAYPIGGKVGKKCDVRSLLLNGDRLWIGTYIEGLKVLDLRTGHVKSYNHLQDTPNTICSDDVLVAYKDRSGDIFVRASWGLCRYNPQRDNFSTITTVGLTISMVDTLEDICDSLRIGIPNGGAFRFNTRNGYWEHFQHERNDSTTITNNSAITLFENLKGTTWVGTNGGGLRSLDPRTETFVDFDPDNTILPNRVIYSIEQDKTGDFWTSSNARLIMINSIIKQHFRQFTVNDGL